MEDCSLSSSNADAGASRNDFPNDTALDLLLYRTKNISGKMKRERMLTTARDAEV